MQIQAHAARVGRNRVTASEPGQLCDNSLVGMSAARHKDAPVLAGW